MFKTPKYVLYSKLVYLLIQELALPGLDLRYLVRLELLKYELLLVKFLLLFKLY